MQSTPDDAILGFCDFHDEDMSVSYIRNRKHGKCIGCWYLTPSEKSYDVSEASRKLSVSGGTVRRWLRSGKLSGVMIANLSRFDFPEGRVNKKWFVTDDSIAQLKR